MIVDEEQEIGPQGMSLEVVWRNPLPRVRTFSKTREENNPYLPMGRTSQQDPRTAVQLEHQKQLG